MADFFHWILLVVLLGFSAFFSASETALFSLSRIEKERLSKTRPGWFRWVNYHLSKPRQVLGAILIGNLFVNTLGAAIATLIASEQLGSLGVGIVLPIFTLLLILFGEILPKIVAVRYNEQVAILTSIPLVFLSFFLTPVLRMVRFICDWLVSRVVRERTASPDLLSEEELRSLVKVGEEEGILKRDERRMIQKIFDFGERQVREIMTPRVSVRGLDVEDTVEKHLDLIREHHFTRFPVCKGSLDNILGVVSVQEYVLGGCKDLPVLTKEPIYVPETKRVDHLLGEFRSKKQDFAVCVDEFGGTAGIVTLEDILEEVFGDFSDEYAATEQAVRPYGFHEYWVDAKISLTELNEALHLNLKSENASTLGGLITETLGEIPERGRIVRLERCELRVADVLRNRAIRCVIVRVLG